MNPIIQSFPEKIESARLYIRPCLPGDGAAVHDALVHSRAELMEWLPFAQKESTLDEVEEGIRKSYAKFILREDFRLHIYRKSDDVFIGSTGLHRIDWDIPKFEIGYWIDSRYAIKGYVTEAVDALTGFAFDFYGANRVEIRCDSKNVRSKLVAERLGFDLEAVMRNDSRSADGKELRDTCVYARTNKN
ncbi:GNAT family N-acetyltransferase [Bacillus sp. M6-12]|uniref:GNAT family N-acetyltransferase n=1 Tax=Bacillus sp. M6-12 TaxID=2054166 RepID=UPI000C77644F|nr:GNAT family N-acetyltransferase [Bacillus sp. M6-12]PLS15392.1 GNAT family N-acetyltransferase [Bacillus sp. M6-12]